MRLLVLPLFSCSLLDFSLAFFGSIAFLSCLVIFTRHRCKITTKIDNMDFSVNGKSIKSDVAPTIVNDRTMVPVRFIAESLGADVE